MAGRSVNFRDLKPEKKKFPIAFQQKGNATLKPLGQIERDAKKFILGERGGGEAWRSKR